MSYVPTATHQRTNGEKSGIKVFPEKTSRILSQASSRRVNFGESKTSAPVAWSENFPIVVHCHLCWDWVWQRPQQFLSRLSQRHKILFVETIGPDPELAAPLARFRKAENCPNVTLVRLQFPLWRWGDGEYVDGERRRLVQELLAGPLAGQFDEAVQWFYDPMAVRAFA